MFNQPLGLIAIEVFRDPLGVNLSIPEDFFIRKRTDVEPFQRPMVAQAGSPNALEVFDLGFGERPRLRRKLPDLIREERLIEELGAQGGLAGHGDGVKTLSLRS